MSPTETWVWICHSNSLIPKIFIANRGVKWALTNPHKVAYSMSSPPLEIIIKGSNYNNDIGLLSQIITFHMK